MRLVIPTGLHALLACLDQALIRCGLAHPENAALLSVNFRQKLENAYLELREKSLQYAETKRVWSLALEQRRQNLDQLSRLCRDAWLMLRRRDQREQHGGLLLDLYQPPRLSPQYACAAIWLEYARSLVHGDALACAAGHAPMAFPSALELEHCLEAAAAAEAAYQTSVLLLQQDAVALREKQRRAAHLLRCMAARLRESQFDQPAAQTRNLLRSFGFSFKTTPSDDAEAQAEQAAATNLVPLPQAVQVPAAQRDREAPKPGGLPQERQLPVAASSGPSSGQPLTRTLLDWTQKLVRGQTDRRRRA